MQRGVLAVTDAPDPTLAVVRFYAFCANALLWNLVFGNTKRKWEMHQGEKE